MKNIEPNSLFDLFGMECVSLFLSHSEIYSEKHKLMPLSDGGAFCLLQAPLSISTRTGPANTLSTCTGLTCGEGRGGGDGSA